MTRWLILLAALAAGLAQGAYHYTEEPAPGLYAVDVGQLPACDYIINSAAGWQQINSASYRVFCVAPGDYRGVAVHLTTSGTAQAPRWIRYHKEGVSATAHPYTFSDANKAQIQQLDMTNASHWVIDRITIDRGAESWSTKSLITGTSSHNVFNRLEFRNNGYGLTFQGAVDSNVVQYSVWYDQHPVDLGYMLLSGVGPSFPTNTRFVSNECWNSSDCIQLHKVDGDNAVVSFPGTVIYNNDLYQTPAKYSDCAGNLNVDGPCARGENALDFKAASSDEANPVIVAHNRMWGFRKSDQTYGGPFSDHGAAVVDHFGISNYRFEGNVVWDSTLAYLQGTTPISSNVFSGNLFHAPAPNHAVYILSTNGLALTGTPVSNLTVERNVFVAGTAGKHLLQVNSTVSGSATFNFRDNVLIDVPSVYESGALAGTASGNAYYASDVLAWDTTATSSATVPEEWVEWCTTIKRITAPTTQCFAKARYQAAGPPPPITAPTYFRILD